jgi:hypothetical protein
MESRTLIRFGVVALVFTLGCTSANPLLPTPPTTVNTDTAASAPTLKVSAPLAQSPSNDEKLARTPVTLTAVGASGIFQSTSAVQLFYRFELYDAAGGRMADSGVVLQPSWTVPVNMNDSERHTWRVRAENGPFVGPWSDLASFLAPNPRPCGPPNFLTPLSIIACHINEYGDNLHGQLEVFLFDVAIDLNRAGVPGGPYGRLRKTSGNNCNGYSCDIICSGQGSRQRQHDILIDERFPIWGSPIGGPRVDVCEIP